MRSAQSITKRRRSLVMLTALLFILVPMTGDIRASTHSIRPYIGVFQGESVTDPAGVLTIGDIDVEIQPARHGFIIDWRSAVIEDGRIVRFNHEVLFERTGSRHIYRAHLAPDSSGVARAPDLIDGRPYFWARLTDSALIVYVMQIMPDGSADLRIYRRSIEGNRMKLEFTRLRDGHSLLTAHGVLHRKVE